MAKILIVKMGYSETLDSHMSRISSLGDVLRTTVILHLFKNDHVTWLVDEKAYLLNLEVQRKNKKFEYFKKRAKNYIHYLKEHYRQPRNVLSVCLSTGILFIAFIFIFWYFREYVEWYMIIAVLLGILGLYFTPSKVLKKMIKDISQEEIVKEEFHKKVERSSKDEEN